MKKLILACSALAALCLTSCSPSKEKLKADWVKTCNESLGSAIPPNSTEALKKAYTDYCSCTGDKVVEKFSAKEIEEIDKLQKGNPDHKKLQELQNKVLPVIQPCITEMQNKLKTEGGGTPAMGM